MEHLYHSSGARRDPHDFIIPALDVENVAEALRLKRALDPVAYTYKVGKHFILDPEWSDFMHQEFRGESTKTVFLDLKDFDIGESSRLFAKQAYDFPVEFFTVHAVRQTMEAAVSQKRGLFASVLAVPLLSSYGPVELKEEYGWDISFDGPVLDFFLRRTERALKCGVDGIVCSPEEVAPVRQEFGFDFWVIVPGVRPQGANLDDHQRSGTPADAIRDGADYVIIGRPLKNAPDPRAAFEEIAEQIGKVI